MLINPNISRKVEFTYTMPNYTYKCEYKAIRPQIAIVTQHYYIRYHPKIAYKKELEDKLIRSKYSFNILT